MSSEETEEKIEFLLKYSTSFKKDLKSISKYPQKLKKVTEVLNSAWAPTLNYLDSTAVCCQKLEVSCPLTTNNLFVINHYQSVHIIRKIQRMCGSRH